jgi:menaquinone-dependent protoporphyrinogen IX oxidase
MKICIAYESKYGNGKKCMEYLQGMLAEDGHEVDLFSVRERDPSSLPEAELYIFSAPTQVGNVAGKMKKFLKKAVIPQENSKYALVTTCMSPPKSKSLKTMGEILKQKGVKKAADGLMIKVQGMKGPCEEAYQDQLKAFARDIAASRA